MTQVSGWKALCTASELATWPWAPRKPVPSRPCWGFREGSPALRGEGLTHAARASEEPREEAWGRDEKKAAPSQTVLSTPPSGWRVFCRPWAEPVEQPQEP